MDAFDGADSQKALAAATVVSHLRFQRRPSLALDRVVGEAGVGYWRKVFTPHVRLRRKGRRGDLLIARGYEVDLEW